MITIPDKNMLQLIELLTASGKIRYRQEFLDVIGMRKQRYIRIKAVEQHFSPEQIAKACAEYGVNANWVLGLEDKIWRLNNGPKITQPLHLPQPNPL